MDSIDLKIISTLSRNARTTVKELAEQVFLSSPAVTSRIEKLEKDKIIKGYHADIDFEKLGVLCSAVINFTLDSDLETEFLNYIKSINMPIIIVSNSSLSKKALSNELESMNILHYFTDLISSSDILYRKPSKEIFDYAFDEIKKYIPNAYKDEIIYIGNDYKLDALGSFNAGLVSYFYNIENRKNISNNINVFYNYLDFINEIKKSLAWG